jgi:hypothetical protein
VPDWTIGVVIARRSREHAAAYAVRFNVHEAACIALVDESAIEGVA